MSVQSASHVCLWMALFCLGCGGGNDAPPLGQVSGTVTVDGQPAANVAVSFTPLDAGRPSSGTTDASGQYQLIYSSSELGAKVGKHTVAIANVVDLENLTPAQMAKPPEGSVPKAYEEMKKEVEVKSGSNTIDLTYP